MHLNTTYIVVLDLKNEKLIQIRKRLYGLFIFFKGTGLVTFNFAQLLSNFLPLWRLISVSIIKAQF